MSDGEQVWLLYIRWSNGHRETIRTAHPEVLRSRIRSCKRR
jgi:hypothetical protein